MQVTFGTIWLGTHILCWMNLKMWRPFHQSREEGTQTWNLLNLFMTHQDSTDANYWTHDSFSVFEIQAYKHQYSLKGVNIVLVMQACSKSLLICDQCQHKHIHIQYASWVFITIHGNVCRMFVEKEKELLYSDFSRVLNWAQPKLFFYKKK